MNSMGGSNERLEVEGDQDDDYEGNLGKAVNVSVTLLGKCIRLIWEKSKMKKWMYKEKKYFK